MAKTNRDWASLSGKLVSLSVGEGEMVAGRVYAFDPTANVLAIRAYCNVSQSYMQNNHYYTKLSQLLFNYFSCRFVASNNNKDNNSIKQNNLILH